MQLTYLAADQAAAILQDAECLASFEGPGNSVTHALECNGRDILMFVDSATGEGMVVDGDAHDADSGGSVHDHARAALAS